MAPPSGPYYYADFPIVRITDKAVGTWATDTLGAKALMASGSTVVLVGGYEPCQDRIIVGALGDGRFEPQFTGRLVADDDALPPTTVLAGRGAELDAFVGRSWYRVDLTDIPTTPPN